jgi:hypothetical protein
VTELKKGDKQPSPVTTPAKRAPTASDSAGSASHDS